MIVLSKNTIIFRLYFLTYYETLRYFNAPPFYYTEFPRSKHGSKWGV